MTAGAAGAVRAKRVTDRSARERLDAILVRRGLLASRTRAQAAILAGEVYVNGVRVDKTGARVPPDAAIDVRPRRPAYVSRGGDKLAHALREFNVPVHDAVAADVGASTGGFTDCLLQHGARRVYAIDVGTGQLDWSLRRDPRVVNLERRDIRSVTPEDVPEPVDLATVDVSFISLRHVLHAVARLLQLDGQAVVLVKPQFETGPKAAKRGVVRDPTVHRAVLAEVMDRVTAEGWTILGATASPIAGPEGNLEFFLYLRHGPGRGAAVDVDAVVASAHATVKRKGQRR